jgi:hypothetical protein
MDLLPSEWVKSVVKYDENALLSRVSGLTHLCGNITPGMRAWLAQLNPPEALCLKPATI